MPWFISSVCSENNITRTFGFKNSYADAYKAICANDGNMQECLYDYLVLEYIEEGIHPMVLSKKWFKWDKDNNKWIEYIAPEELKNITNFALG